MKIINTFLFILLSFQTYGQVIPNFQFTLYATDAVGNVDSVILGFDTAATLDIDPAFGEVALNTPFDSIFEIRAGTLYRAFNLHLKLSKKHITNAEVIPGHQNHCLIGFDIVVYVQAKFPPVTFSWDQNRFNKTRCIKNSLLTFHDADTYVDPFNWFEFPNMPFYCMANEASLSFVPDSNLLANTGFYPLSVEKEVEGQGNKTLYGVRFLHSPYPGWSPCQFLVKATDLDQASVKLFPNPVAEILQITPFFPDQSFSIFTVNGVEVKEGRIQNGQIFISALPKGMYLLYLEQSFGPPSIHKFIKL